MGLNRERITLNPYEESSSNVPLEVGGDRFGHGIFVQPGGSQWPTAEVTPQIAQSVDTEGGLAAATTVGLKKITLKLQVLEPNDPGGVNLLTDPATVGFANGATTWAFQGAGGMQSVQIRDLVGFDYAIALQTLAQGSWLQSPLTSVSPRNTNYTLGAWLRGESGGELAAIQANQYNGAQTNSPTFTLTSEWQWYTYTVDWTTPSGWVNIVPMLNSTMTMYATGMALVEGSSLVEYFDGSFPGCSWDGTPNASSSTRPSSGGPRMLAAMADLERVVDSISRYRTGAVRRTLPSSAGSNTRATYDLVGAELTWDDTSMVNAGVAKGTVTLTAEPYARGPEMTTVLDDFNILLGTSYTVDAGALSNYTTNNSSYLTAQSNLTTENRFINTVSPYPFYTGEVSAQFTPETTISGFKGGVVLKRTSSSDYMEAYVTDNGTSSVLNLDTILGGTRTNVATDTLAARIASGTPFVVRALIQRQNNQDKVLVEYFANATDPVWAATAPTAALGVYNPSDARLVSAAPSACGFVNVPQGQARVTGLRISPNLARERSLPVLRFGLTGVPGTAPGLGRMVVAESASQTQMTVMWGEQHDSLGRMSSHTDLFYEAESLTLAGGAGILTLSGASGGSVVQSPALTSNPVEILTTAVSGVNLAHIGNFAVYARVYSGTACSLYLQWSTGDFQSWTQNSTYSPPSSGWYIAPLGAIQVPEAVGTQQWQGKIFASSTGSSQRLDVDCIWLVPLDDGAAVISGVVTTDAAVYSGTELEVRSDRCNRQDSGGSFWVPVSSYTGQYMKMPVPPESDGFENIVVKGSRGSISPGDAVSTTRSPTAVTTNSAPGTVNWTNPNNVLTAGSDAYAWTSANPANVGTYYLVITGYGFAIPTGAAIVGIQASIPKGNTNYQCTTSDNDIRLVRAGVVEPGGDHASSAAWTQVNATDPAPAPTFTGGDGDLWSASWTPSDINNSGFGIAISAYIQNTTGNTTSAQVWNPVQLTVWYTPLAAGDAGIDAIQAQVSVTPRYANVADL